MNRPCISGKIDVRKKGLEGLNESSLHLIFKIGVDRFPAYKADGFTDALFGKENNRRLPRGDLYRLLCSFPILFENRY
jgi:hypothetical protein